MLCPSVCFSGMCHARWVRAELGGDLVKAVLYRTRVSKESKSGVNNTRRRRNANLLFGHVT